MDNWESVREGDWIYLTKFNSRKPKFLCKLFKVFSPKLSARHIRAIGKDSDVIITLGKSWGDDFIFPTKLHYILNGVKNEKKRIN